MFEITDMMKLAQQYLDDALPRAALALIFGNRRHTLAALDPTDVETNQFIDLLLAIDSVEDKKTSPPRQSAWKLIKDYNNNPGVSKFAGISPAKFAFQLALRVREPNLISQGEIGVCGANAAVIHFAKADPVGYVRLGLDLMLTGRGHFGKKEVAPGETIMAGVTKLNLAVADYVILTSVRGSASFVEGVLSSRKASQVGVAEAMTERDVSKMLRLAGYTEVEDHVHSNTHLNLKENLNIASLRVGQGYLVMFSINSNLAVAMIQDKKWQTASALKQYLILPMMAAGVAQKSGSGTLNLTKRWMANTNHWVLVSKLQVSAQEVTIKLYSWGHSIKRTIPYDRFVEYYDGFISAKLGGEEKLGWEEKMA